MQAGVARRLLPVVGEVQPRAEHRPRDDHADQLLGQSQRLAQDAADVDRARAVEEQSGVAKHIATSVQDASHRVKDVDENMIGIEQAANDTGVAADQVNQAVGEVQGAFSDMKSQMQQVMTQMGVKV